MKNDSPFKCDRFAGFATILKAGCEMTKGRRMNWLALALPSFVLVAAIGHFTAARVEAQQSPPTHQAILDSVGAVQTTVNSIETKIDNIKAKLDLIPPAWSQTLGANRFQLVLGGAGVLDKETGLVWEQSPSMATFSWYGALNHCYPLGVGGRKGWRLPKIEELASLVDTSNQFPALPTGHLFTINSSEVEDRVHWSATTEASNNTGAYDVTLGSGEVSGFDKASGLHHVWCVRGGQGIDGVQ